MSFSANRNPLLRDFFHCNLLIISFIGGVQWNKDLGPPAVMSHLIEGGARRGQPGRIKRVRVVGSQASARRGQPGRINAQPLGYIGKLAVTLS